MAIDPSNWDPMSVDEVASLFRPLGIPWWIAGGWALDLFVGSVTRKHGDIDVQIVRKDQLILQEHLRGWDLFKTGPQGLAPWPRDEYLGQPINSIWARRDTDSPWSFQVILMETEGERWIYRPVPAMGGELGGLGLMTNSGVPFISPEIQLLYKSYRNEQKDFDDLRQVLPHMSADGLDWLLTCLQIQYRTGHEWIDYIRQFREAAKEAGEQELE